MTDSTPAGQIILVNDWRIIVERVTRDGRPARVRVEPSSIDNPELTWITWHDASQRYERVSLPAVGGSLWLPGAR